MKKLLILLSLIFIISCVKDEHEYIDPFVEVPEELQIVDEIGIKLESTIVTNQVAMNVKLPEDGVYRIKIRHGMNNELISQERVNGTEGDNILKVYTSTLDKSGYMIQLTDEFHNVLGASSFVVN
jgi:hypothetical protein